MSGTRRMIRQTLTIARRDFIATAFTPTFLIFLFAPLFMFSFAGVGTIGASSMSDDEPIRARMAAVVPVDDEVRVRQADARVRMLFRTGEAPPALEIVPAAGDPVPQAERLVAGGAMAAVLVGPIGRQSILYGENASRGVHYLAAVADAAARGPVPPPIARLVPARIEVGATDGGRPLRRNPAAFLTVFGIFFLTLLLAGQAAGTMAEERNNKVIEVLAAAVPLEAVFLGKLLGMFGVACLFVAFWGTIAANVEAVLPAGMAAQLGTLAPAVGLPIYGVLFFVYFSMAYMLLGAVFLSVGAQASTVREVQMLSLPITLVQVGMFALASTAASRPGSAVATAAELFPLSSPFAMGARAVNRPELWPHLAAIAWQLMWVSLVIAVGARAFRRGVLKSGSARPRRGRRARTMEVEGSDPISTA